MKKSSQANYLKRGKTHATKLRLVGFGFNLVFLIGWEGDKVFQPITGQHKANPMEYRITMSIQLKIVPRHSD